MKENIERYGYTIIIGFICFFVIIVSLFFLRDVQNSINEQKSAWNTVISAPNSYEYFLDGQKKNKNFNIRAVDQESYKIVVDENNVYLTKK